VGPFGQLINDQMMIFWQFLGAMLVYMGENIQYKNMPMKIRKVYVKIFVRGEII